MSEQRRLHQAIRERGTQHLRAVVATGGSARAWTARIAGGGAVAGTGLALLHYLPVLTAKVPGAPWWLGALLLGVGITLILVGVNGATNGLLVRGIKALADVYKDVRGTT